MSIGGHFELDEGIPTWDARPVAPRTSLSGLRVDVDVDEPEEVEVSADWWHVDSVRERVEEDVEFQIELTDEVASVSQPTLDPVVPRRKAVPVVHPHLQMGFLGGAVAMSVAIALMLAI